MFPITRFAVALVALLSQSAAFADDANCTAQQDQLNGLGQKYKALYDGYEKEGNDMKSDVSGFVNFKVTWADTDIIFDTPTVKIVDQKIIFGVPQTTLKNQDIIFDTPSVRMVQVKTGQYPEFTCDHALIPSCTVTWSNTYASVPQTFMQQQRINMGIPEFTWANTQIIMGVPQFSMQRQHWVVGLPQFTLTGAGIAAANPKPMEDKADNLKARITATTQTQKSETVSATHAIYACYRTQIQQSRQDATTKFNQGLATIDSIIQAMKAQGADPTKVPGADGKSTDLVAQRAYVAAQRDKAMSQFDDALAKLDSGEKEAVTKMTST